MDGHGARGALPPRRRRDGSGKAEYGTRTFTIDIGSPAQPAQVPGQLPEALLSKLATRMRYGDYPWPQADLRSWTDDDNDALPAGYTYLAQLVAHDFVENTAQLEPVGSFPGPLQKDYRAQRLVLDTIYGGGADRSPWIYATAASGHGNRCKLRLGHVRAQEQLPFEPLRPPLTDQPARDIARMRCPHLTDVPDERSTPDVLVADSRNDQHLVISQMAALFHEFHNVVFEKVAALQASATGSIVDELNFPRREDYASDAAFNQHRDALGFLLTRKLVALVYRRIVVDDLLGRLLEPGVLAFYTARERSFPADHFFRSATESVPVEFSHSVFRFGHVMARFSYKLNDKLASNATMTSLLNRTSSGLNRLVPLAADWLIDWSEFFDMGDGRHWNRARRIRPYIAWGPLGGEAVVPPEKDRDGGLFYRDLLRGREAQVASVDSLVARLRPADRERSDLLKDQALRQHEIGEWLKHGGHVDFSLQERRDIAANPPLVFFVLFEAAFTQGGERLGILGSTIVADVFFAALQKARPLIEDDPAMPTAVREVFGQAPPASMPSLIAFIKSNGGLGDVVVDPNVG